jgi:hypothetical protein
MPEPATETERNMQSPRTVARVAGLLYLVLVITGVFAHLVVRDSVYEQGNATATLENIIADATMFRFALVADIVMATSFVALGIVLYLLLSQSGRAAATAMTVFVSVGVGMILLNLTFHYAALLVATGDAYSSLASVDNATLVLLLMDMHHYGYTLAGIFFGLWLIPLGYLARKSGYFPPLLGTLLIVAGGACFIAPDLNETVHFVLTLPTFAEFAMLLYLLIRGVRTQAGVPVRVPA